MASDPYAGMAWMHMQMVVGLRRLGHDVYYFETTSSWPYDPIQQARVCCSEYAVSYLARVAEKFGLADRWAYRRSYGDKAWFGLDRSRAEELLAHADVVLNVAGATRLAEEELKVGRLVYYGTDPVCQEIAVANADRRARRVRDIWREHRLARLSRATFPSLTGQDASASAGRFMGQWCALESSVYHRVQLAAGRA